MTNTEFVFKEKIEIKLLILYILHQSKAIAKQNNLERQFLVDFCMEHIRISYFDLQECISELCEDNIVSSYTKNHKDVLILSDKGEFMLNQFLREIPYSVRDKIDNKISGSITEYKDEQSVTVDYWKENENYYTTLLKITDGDQPAMQLSVSFDNKTSAQALVHQFKKHPEEFYKQILQICDEAINNDLNEK